MTKAIGGAGGRLRLLQVSGQLCSGEKPSCVLCLKLPSALSLPHFESLPPLSPHTHTPCSHPPWPGKQEAGPQCLFCSDLWILFVASVSQCVVSRWAVQGLNGPHKVPKPSGPGYRPGKLNT